jgi:hypothetical protein
MKKLLKVTIWLYSIFLLLAVSGQTAAAQQDPSLKILNNQLIAGQSLLVMAASEPNTTVQLAFTNPYGSSTVQQVQVNSTGIAQYWYQQTKLAGIYSVSYNGNTQSFTVNADKPDAAQSSFVLSDYTIPQGKTTEAEIVLRDQYGNPVINSRVELTSKKNTLITCTNHCVTDRNGKVTVAFKTRQQGLDQLRVVSGEGTLLQAELGILPTLTQDSYSMGSLGFSDYNAAPQYNSLSFLNPLTDRYQASGNDDMYIARSSSPTFSYKGLSDYFSADLVTPNSSGSNSTLANNTAQGQIAGFEIIFGSDHTDTYENQITVSANTALDFFIKAVDASGNVVTNYMGEVEMKIDPVGPMLPGTITGSNTSTFSFGALDQGIKDFALSLILSHLQAGHYTLTVSERLNPNITGEVEISTTLAAVTPATQTSLVLTVNSPAANGVYSGDISLQGTTNTDNTDIIVTEGGLEIKKLSVSPDKTFQDVLSLADGPHTLQIKALYRVDNTESVTTVQLEVDNTPPIIQQVTAPTDPVRPGENFTITATASEGDLIAIIDNVPYDFVKGSGLEYSLTKPAPQNLGTHPIHIRAVDAAGNSVEQSNIGNLVVIEALQEITGIIGFPPSAGALTLSWDPVQGADHYDVTYQSILGSSQDALRADTNEITVDNLTPETHYIFTIEAIGPGGTKLSLLSRSQSLLVLGSATGETTPAVVASPNDQGGQYGAAEPQVQTTPTKHSQTGPEVYVYILFSLLILHLYGKMRRRMAEESC